MLIKDIFSRKIDRNINGVVKATDDLSLANELEEYVLTADIEKNIQNFLEAYLNNTLENGVWISGYYGSGKSHLLKMLSVLLENKIVAGKSAVDWFIPKTEDVMLQALFRRLETIPSKSILYNIYEKESSSGNRETRLIGSLWTVFNELFGFSINTKVAQFERGLSTNGYYGAFTADLEQHGFTWNNIRDYADLYRTQIDSAFARVTGQKVEDVIGRSQTLDSIDALCGEINKYIDSQKNPNFRLNFFIDEMGQYIANDSQAMVQLQTFVETLSTKCKGKAWVFVISQEDFSKILGRLTTTQSQDFSKIQARFLHRIKLDSQGVEDVVKERLLLKNEQGLKAVSDLYQENELHLKSSFIFTQDSRTLPEIKSEDDFVRAYPFLPFQFRLYQRCVNNFSGIGAFEGQYSSVGERSLLGGFQFVAKDGNVKDKELGILVPFWRMYESLSSMLKTEVRAAINQAEKDLGDEFAVTVLKALFLLKYNKEIKANKENIAILLIDNVGQNTDELMQRVTDALDLLERESYIEKDAGGIYNYLSNEEKNIEERIKYTAIEDEDIYKELGMMIFEEIIKDRKVRDGNNDYPFTGKVNGSKYRSGKDFDLSIDILTPNIGSGGESKESFYAFNHIGTLGVLLPKNDELASLLRLYKQTEKFINQESGVGIGENFKNLLDEKQRKNRARRILILKLLGESLQEATFLGTQHATYPRGSAADRIRDAFVDLVYSVFTKPLCKDYREDEIFEILNSNNFCDEVKENKLTQDENNLLEVLRAKRDNDVQVVVKLLVEEQRNIPYGWMDAGTKCVLASLSSKDKIDLVDNQGTILEKPLDKREALTNSVASAKTFVKIAEEFSPIEVRNLRSFAQEYFGEPLSSSGSQPTQLYNEIKEKFKEKKEEFEHYIQSCRGDGFEGLPFVKKLTEIKDHLKDLVDRPRQFWFKELPCVKEQLLTEQEEFIAPLERFFNNGIGVLKSASATIRDLEVDRDYVQANYQKLKQLINDPEIFQKARELKLAKEALTAAFKTQLDMLKQKAFQLIEAKKKQVTDTSEWKQLDQEDQQKFLGQLDASSSRVTDEKYCIQLRVFIDDFDKNVVEKIREEIIQKITPEEPDEVKTPKPEIINISSLRPKSGKVLKNEEDVQDFIDEIKTILLEKVKTHNGILIQ